MFLCLKKITFFFRLYFFNLLNLLAICLQIRQIQYSAKPYKLTYLSIKASEAITVIAICPRTSFAALLSAALHQPPGTNIKLFTGNLTAPLLYFGPNCDTFEPKAFLDSLLSRTLTLKWKYHCTTDLLFYFIGLSCFAYLD